MREQKGIFIPESDKYAFWSKNYEIRSYESLKKKGLFGGNLALDIGAHVGIWTRRLSQDFDKVIAFEPIPKHIECHKVNCAGLDNVELITTALSNKKDEGVMTTKDNNSGVSTLGPLKMTKDTPQYVTVQTDTLDNFKIKDKIDFIKMDVEGFEEQVLAGAVNTIMEHRPPIFIEIWAKKYDQIYPILTKDLGYSVEKESGQNYICMPL
jgi:FkbM family methyltransferase